LARRTKGAASRPADAVALIRAVRRVMVIRVPPRDVPNSTENAKNSDAG
jgi:hypothetical protein